MEEVRCYLYYGKPPCDTVLGKSWIARSLLMSPIEKIIGAKH